MRSNSLFLRTALACIGHSYGTIPIAWMVKLYPELVQRVVLMDPITLYLHRPGACKSFLYEKDMTQGFARDFYSYLFNRDPGIVHTLMRNFNWSTNTLWLSELLRLKSKHAIMLSEHDEYIPSAPIKQYLEEINRNAQKNGKEHPVNLYWGENLGHGEFLTCSESFRKVFQFIIDYKHL